MVSCLLVKSSPAGPRGLGPNKSYGDPMARFWQASQDVSGRSGGEHRAKTKVGIVYEGTK